MQGFFDGVDNVSGFIWGGTWNGAQILPVGMLAVMLLGTGAWFMIVLKGRPITRFLPALGEVWAGRKAQGVDGAITPWQALSTALSGQVGTGNLAGVATAITFGGPGAIFWMWVTALLGMACAFAESSLAVKYRESDPGGRLRGGPMYYIKHGLNKGKGGAKGAFGWLAVLFVFGTLLSALATGGMIQSNSIAQSALETGRQMSIDIPAWLIGIILSVLVFSVIIGGIKSIGSIAGKVVPFMAGAYVLLALVVLIMNAPQIPAAFGLIFSHAFGLEQAAGGAAGYGVLQAIRYGVARGLFSNEAGQGSAPIAHSTAMTSGPAMQGEIAMIGVFIDTIIICTMTALVLLVVPGAYPSAEGVVEFVWMSTELDASAKTTAAYAQAIPFGNYFVTVALFLFAFTTILGWSYYAETAITYLFGEKAAMPVRFVWVVVVFLGTIITDVDSLWRLGDIANASMAFPNLLAILLLSGTVLTIANNKDAPGKPLK
ncbi:alanine/glycine:cation symporter family protein [Aquisalinus flavus]|uniref:Sodium:alanine symporter n=1 Tax=Aquisalinus flavus TaxID=1526572 RepID=A0A8J2Y858_9PROT|nr:alanine/glycine:cation symporter family protein [Aquisalinus flavus]MBD0425679.1 alanine:cation symporter family protein [Aquisalinus flavus]UNE48709.1 alanine:cation symporter family protein [Aquisalinus flavus]GGD14118.1 sodium:alanine symporter [Aquisalinus flavus]